MKIVIDIDNETYGRIQALVNADYFEHDICGYSMKRIAHGIPYEERPKGVWIVKQEMAGAFVGDSAVYSYTCPFCGVKEFKKYPFCHCGADLRGGRE